MKQMSDIYSDYLTASFSQTSATDLSNLVNSEISRDQVVRFLSQEKNTAKDLWLIAKHFSLQNLKYQKLSQSVSFATLIYD